MHVIRELEPYFIDKIGILNEFTHKINFQVNF